MGWAREALRARWRWYGPALMRMGAYWVAGGSGLNTKDTGLNKRQRIRIAICRARYWRQHELGK